MEYREVTLQEMLDARERRADIQVQMLKEAGEQAHGHEGEGQAYESHADEDHARHRPSAVLISFTMNIAGPVKNSPMILRAFHMGMEELELSLKRCRVSVLKKREICDVTGNECFYTVAAPARAVKEICCELEDADELGRLYDMDVLETAQGHHDPGQEKAIVKIERQSLGLSERRCLICGLPGRDCASRRVHTVEQLQERTRQIIEDALRRRGAERIAEYAVRSLLYEVCTTPKPGLVDRDNSGSHDDMDIYTFMRSAACLYPYFEECFQAGYDGARLQEKPRKTFDRLRIPGKQAENNMLRATEGVNTHKGAIFTLGIVCGAIGRVFYNGCGQGLCACSGSSGLGQPGGSFINDDGIVRCIAGECAEMTRGLVKEDMRCVNKELTDEACRHLTHGQLLYRRYGITGVRGQIEAGLPAVIDFGLPLLEKLLSEGKSEDEAGSAVLLAMIAHSEDTNMIARSDVKTQKEEARRAAGMLEDILAAQEPAQRSVLKELDDEYISRHLSPGGSADLLAVCWMLHFCRSM